MSTETLSYGDMVEQLPPIPSEAQRIQETRSVAS